MVFPKETTEIKTSEPQIPVPESCADDGKNGSRMEITETKTSEPLQTTPYRSYTESHADYRNIRNNGKPAGAGLMKRRRIRAMQSARVRRRENRAAARAAAAAAAETATGFSPSTVSTTEKMDKDYCRWHVATRKTKTGSNEM